MSRANRILYSLGEKPQHILFAQMEGLCKYYPLHLVDSEPDSLQGIFWGYVIFDFVAVFAFSWLYLHGVRNMKRWLSERKMRKSKANSS